MEEREEMKTRNKAKRKEKTTYRSYEQTNKQKSTKTNEHKYLAQKLRRNTTEEN